MEIPSPNRIISNDRVVIPASVSIVCRWVPPQLVSHFNAELAWPKCLRCGCKVLTCSLVGPGASVSIGALVSACPFASVSIGGNGLASRSHVCGCRLETNLGASAVVDLLR